MVARRFLLEQRFGSARSKQHRSEERPEVLYDDTHCWTLSCGKDFEVDLGECYSVPCRHASKPIRIACGDRALKDLDAFADTPRQDRAHSKRPLHRPISISGTVLAGPTP